LHGFYPILLRGLKQRRSIPHAGIRDNKQKKISALPPTLSLIRDGDDVRIRQGLSRNHLQEDNNA